MSGWVRLWHDMPTDPKWRTIARKSGQRVGDVMAVFSFMLVSAGANSDERGALCGFDVEDVATALDLDESAVVAIMDAMQGKVLDGKKLTGWEKRQPKREDGTAAERKSAWKERQKQQVAEAERNGTQENAAGTHGNAPEADADADAEELETNVSCASGDALKPEHVVEIWNEAAPKLGKPAVRTLTPSRRKLLKDRIGQYELDDFQDVFGKIERSAFLRGDSGWRGCTFDWVFKRANFQKILEGNYDH